MNILKGMWIYSEISTECGYTSLIYIVVYPHGYDYIHMENLVLIVAIMTENQFLDAIASQELGYVSQSVSQSLKSKRI